MIDFVLLGMKPFFHGVFEGLSFARKDKISFN